MGESIVTFASKRVSALTTAVSHAKALARWFIVSRSASLFQEKEMWLQTLVARIGHKWMNVVPFTRNTHSSIFYRFQGIQNIRLRNKWFMSRGKSLAPGGRKLFERESAGLHVFSWKTKEPNPHIPISFTGAGRGIVHRAGTSAYWLVFYLEILFFLSWGQSRILCAIIEQHKTKPNS